MAHNTSENPLFQVWRQWHGSSHELLAEFHGLKAAKIFLVDMRRRERMRGKKCLDNDNCGFTSYVGTIADMSPRAHYWWDVVMTDEAINSDSPPIYMGILEKIAEARTMGIVYGREMREAKAAGVPYDPGEDSPWSFLSKPASGGSSCWNS